MDDLPANLPCPRCGTPLDRGKTRGTCPACALGSVLGDETVVGGEDALFLSDIPPLDTKPGTEGSDVSTGADSWAHAPAKPGDRIGPYKLLEEIGEGGFGVVYMAEQTEPIVRRVALKVIKLGMDTRQVIARFEAERQALALMDHPNIAKVLDAGATVSGRPYFVMELVRGVPITEYCDRNRLGSSGRLELFVAVCQAIQHAHQKGIIHRDIKPSNVLVTLHDGRPVPMVIDFGIAKATNQKLTEKTLFTSFAAMIGTPAYMSPEQAEMSKLDVDTRSDIYSLGVLLYELLTGTTPFPEKRLRSAGYGEMQRIIAEEEPERLSARLSTMEAAQRTAIARNRSADAAVLNRLFQGDLDWIVVKCLEKDRTRRYETANALAADIDRHLKNEPVAARPPTVAYRLQKILKRNQRVAVAAACFALLLVLATVVSTWQAMRATKAEHAQLALRRKAEDAQARESALRAAAEQRIYDSLVREARALRLAHHVGYREEAIRLIRQAHALSVPGKNQDELRREVVQCLGDFLGLHPQSINQTPGGGVGQWAGSFSPQSDTMVSGWSDGTLVFTDLASTREVARAKAAFPPFGLEFSRDGKEVLGLHVPNAYLGNEDWSRSTLYFWKRVSNGSWRQISERLWPGTRQILPSREGFYAVATNGFQVVVTDVGTSTDIGQFPSEVLRSRYPALAINPAGDLLALENLDQADAGNSVVDLWEVRPARKVATVRPKLSTAEALQFNQDGRILGFLSGVGGALFDVESHQLITGFVEHFEPHSGFSFAPRARVIALPMVQLGQVRLWDWNLKKDVALFGHAGAYWVDYSRDGSKLIVSGIEDSKIYGLKRPEKLILEGHEASIPSISFSRDGSQLGSVGKDRKLKVWNTETGALVWERGLPGQGQSIAYSADGRQLATTDLDTEAVEIWDATTGEATRRMLTQSPGQWFTQFCCGTNRLITLSDQAVALWDLSPQASAAPLKSFPFRSRIGATLPVGETIFCFVDYDIYQRRLMKWDVAKDAPPVMLAAHLGPQALIQTADGKMVFYVDEERGITGLDLANGTRRKYFSTIDTNLVKSWTHVMVMALSPDGSKLATSSPTALGVDIWDFESEKLLYSLPEEPGTIYSLAWHPGSSRLAVARASGDLAIWDIREIELILASIDLAPEKNASGRPAPSVERSK